MEKIERKLLDRLIIGIIILALLVTIYQGFNGTFFNKYKDTYERVEINLKDYHDLKGNYELIKKDDINKLRKTYSPEGVSYYTNRNTILSKDKKFFYVKAMMTDNTFLNFNKINIIKGSFICESASDIGRNVVVISSSLAYNLFQSMDVIGNRVNIFGKEYKIVGVYERDKSLIGTLGWDGFEQIYLPFNSIEATQQLPISTIVIKDKWIESTQFKEYKVKNDITRSVNADISRYVIKDYYDKALILAQLNSICFFLIGIWCMVLLIIYFKKYMIGTYYKVKIELKNNYFVRVLLNNKIYLLKLLMTILLFSCLICGVYFITKFQFYVPPKYIPNDNIFDIGFYSKVINGIIQQSNSMYSYVPTQFELDYYNTLKLNVIMTMGIVIVFIVINSFVGLLKTLDIDSTNIIKSLISSLIMVIVSTVILNMLLGFNIDWVIYLKRVLLIYLFIVLRVGCFKRSYISCSGKTSSILVK